MVICARYNELRFAIIRNFLKRLQRSETILPPSFVPAFCKYHFLIRKRNTPISLQMTLGKIQEIGSFHRVYVVYKDHNDYFFIEFSNGIYADVLVR